MINNDNTRYPKAKILIAGIDETGSPNKDNMFGIGAFVTFLENYRKVETFISLSYWKEILKQVLSEDDETTDDLFRKLRKEGNKMFIWEVKGRYVYSLLNTYYKKKYGDKNRNEINQQIEQSFAEILNIIRNHFNEYGIEYAFSFVGTNPKRLEERLINLIISLINNHRNSRNSDEFDIISKMPDTLEVNTAKIVKRYIIQELIKRLVGITNKYVSGDSLIIWVDEDACETRKSDYLSTVKKLVEIVEIEQLSTGSEVPYNIIAVAQLHQSHLNPMIQMADLLTYSLSKVVSRQWQSPKLKNVLKQWIIGSGFGDNNDNDRILKNRCKLLAIDTSQYSPNNPIYKYCTDFLN